MLPVIHAQENYLAVLDKHDSVFRIPEFAVPNAIVSSRDTNTVFQFNVTLSRMPPTNVVAINIEYANVSFHYQPPLTEEFDAKDFDILNATHAIDKNGTYYRPLNVVGSYAVYGLHRDNQYTTGKLFHIYRPLLVDSRGLTSWANITIDKSLLTITMNMTFLVTASYPVIIDPSFGKTDVGGTSYTGSGIAHLSEYALTEDGTVTELHGYFYNNNAGPNDVSCGIYTGTTLIERATGSAPNGGSWVTCDIADTAESSGTYGLAVKPQKNAISVYYDATAATCYLDTGLAETDPCPSPFQRDAGPVTRDYSIYANYTTGGAQEFTYELLETAALTASLYLGIERILFGGETPATTEALLLGRENAYTGSETAGASDLYRVLRELAFLPDSTTTVTASLSKALEGGFVIIEISETAATTASIVFVKEILLGLTEITVTVASSSIGKEVTEILVEIAETLITTAVLYFTTETITFTLTDVFGIAALALILALVAFVLVLVKRRNE